MNRRLQQFLTAENISQSQFAESIGVARANVSHILSGRNKPGFDFIEKMLTSYPALNVDWLITGKGKMYRNTSATPSVDSGAFSYAAQDEYSQSERGGILESSQGDIFQSAMNYAGEDDDATSPLRNGTEYMGNAAGSASNRSVVNGLAAAKRPVQKNSRTKINTFDDLDNHPNNQRVITKIIVYYSDNTYQELK